VRLHAAQTFMLISLLLPPRGHIHASGEAQGLQ
jgi:hypothetical protein